MPRGGAVRALAWDGPGDVPTPGSTYPEPGTEPGTEPRHRAARARGRSSVLRAAVALLITALLILAAGTLMFVVQGDAADSHPGVPIRAIRQPVPSAHVGCWDGTTAGNAHACGIPRGRRGLASVFSTLGPDCSSVSSMRSGELENIACRSQDYVIRYSRWQPGFDRFGFFDRRNSRTGVPWTVAGAFAGRQWSSVSADRAGLVSFRWSATYRSEPFAVEVAASTARGRADGVAAVHAAASAHLGRG